MTPFTSMEGVYQIKWPWDWQAARRRDKTQKPAGCCLRGTAVPAVRAHPTTTALLPLAFLWPLGRTDGGPRPAAGSSAPERTHARWVVLAKCKFFSFFWPTRLLAVGDDGWTFFCWSRDETGIIRAAGLSVT